MDLLQALVELIQPFLGPDASREYYAWLMRLAHAAWRIDLLQDEADTDAVLDELDVRAHAEVVDAMLRRKRRRFPGDHRSIGELEITRPAPDTIDIRLVTDQP